MPVLANAKKALRSSQRKAVMNARTKQRMRTAIKSAKLSTDQDSVSMAFSSIDRALKRNLLHANKAARMKRQLARLTSQASKRVTSD